MKDKYCPEKCVSFPDNTKKKMLQKRVLQHLGCL